MKSSKMRQPEGFISSIKTSTTGKRSSIVENGQQQPRKSSASRRSSVQSNSLSNSLSGRTTPHERTEEEEEESDEDEGKRKSFKPSLNNVPDDQVVMRVREGKRVGVEVDVRGKSTAKKGWAGEGESEKENDRTRRWSAI
jgi:hypothetical protein